MNSNDFIWFKSSHSQGDGSECVEVADSWRKSSHSGGAAGDCVEVAALSHVVHIRDSKRPRGPRLAVPADAWAHFVAFTSVG
ncbi:DUF397 domain-containing protein [Streptomyces sp. VNUA116]|uniref:DUF397 domain-containing protein n=1 Tax=Streptomyces sp. VNUA116 TaxID=3062449 RepID=UPI0026747043|nr:DUF397 domain-containing protein [Streptomyces sp. VNUA116]WKU44591.1 DUF397 domain-containing protein [Streptomyces sp. VNUA116]